MGVSAVKGEGIRGCHFMALALASLLLLAVVGAAQARTLATHLFSFGDSTALPGMRQIALDSTGRILVSGGWVGHDDVPGVVYLHRYTSSGAFDTSLYDAVDPAAFDWYFAVLPDDTVVRDDTPIAVDPLGNRYVLLEVLNRNWGIVRKTDNYGNPLAEWDVGPYTEAILIGLDGLLYADRIHPGAGLWGGPPHYADVYDLDGVFLRGGIPLDFPVFNGGIYAVDPSGNLYVGAYDWTYVWWLEKRSARGEPLSTLTRAGGETLAGIADAGINRTGRLAIADGTRSRIHVFQLSPSRFSDIPLWFWAMDDIEALADAGIVKGFSDGTYQPALAVDRAQLAVYLARGLAGGDANVPPGPAEPTYWDVPPDHWAYKYVEYLNAQGIVEGSARGLYGPTAIVTRGTMAVFLARALAGGDSAIPAPPIQPTFPDVTSRGAWAWCYKHVEYLANQGIISGYADGRYHPESEVDRGQMAVFVARVEWWDDPEASAAGLAEADERFRALLESVRLGAQG